MTDICARFGCVAWVVHQIAGAACAHGPTTKLRHTDALGCRSFAVNAYYALVISNKDDETNTCQIFASKTRRGPPTLPVVCRLDGDIGEMTPMDSEYVYSEADRRPVRRSDLNVFNGRPRRNQAMAMSDEDLLAAVGQV
jgi:hypothetical protein